RALDLLDEEEEQVASVEDREGEEVQEAEVDAHHREEIEEAPEAAFRSELEDARDSDGAREILRGDVLLDEASQREEDLLADVDRALHAESEGFAEPGAQHVFEGAQRGRFSDEADRLVLGGLERQCAGADFSVRVDPSRCDVCARSCARDELLKRREGVDRLAVELDEAASRLDSRAVSGTARDGVDRRKGRPRDAPILAGRGSAHRDRPPLSRAEDLERQLLAARGRSELLLELGAVPDVVSARAEND